MTEIGEIRQESNILNLDLKDKKILSSLMGDARASLSEISNKVKLSKSNVSRRIMYFEKSGLIGGYHAFIDASKLGLKTTIILLKTRTTHNEREDYFKKISTKNNVYTVTEIIGDFDVAIGVYSKNEEEKEKALDEILKESFITNFEICEVKTLFPSLSYTEKIEAGLIKSKTITRPIELDLKDKKILLSLSKNCRVTSIDLEEQLKLPRTTINYRIKNLIQTGVIAKFQPTVNFFMLGVEFYFLRFKLSRPSENEAIIKYLSNTGKANTILKSDSSCQLMAFLFFKDNSEFRSFEENILEKFGGVIQDYSFSIAKSQYKLDWLPAENL